MIHPDTKEIFNDKLSYYRMKILMVKKGELPLEHETQARQKLEEIISIFFTDNRLLSEELERLKNGMHPENGGYFTALDAIKNKFL